MDQYNIPVSLKLPPFEDVCTQAIEGKRLYTLVFLFEDDQILLGIKKRGFGKGKLNGFGGKVEPNETIEDSARREFNEEAGVLIHDLEKIAKIDFVFSGRPTAMETHVFVAKGYTGKITETEEMSPCWFQRSLGAIPFESMWSDDHIWFPLLLNGQTFEGKFYIDGSDESTILGASLYLQ